MTSEQLKNLRDICKKRNSIILPRFEAATVAAINNVTIPEMNGFSGQPETNSVNIDFVNRLANLEHIVA